MQGRGISISRSENPCLTYLSRQILPEGAYTGDEAKGRSIRLHDLLVNHRLHDA